MLSRSKKSKGDSDLSYHGNSNFKNDESKQKQYKRFGIIGGITLVIVLILYSNGNLSLFSSSSRQTLSSSQYIIGHNTQKAEEATNQILSAWGQSSQALKFANLPSSGQGYLTVTAMVIDSSGKEKKEKINIFYREASKMNPGGFGISNKLVGLGAINKITNKLRNKVDHVDNVDNVEEYVINKDVTLIFLHGKDYASSTWEELGTLSYFANLGYKIYGIDIPGHGHSDKVTVKKNGWLIETIIKLVTSQEEEGNIDEDGGEHHTDSHDKKNKNNDVSPSSKKIHKIAIISPDFSVLYTFDLLKKHQELLGRDQGIEFIKYVPISAATSFITKLFKKDDTDNTDQQILGLPFHQQYTKMFEDNIVNICSIGGALDFQFTHNNLIFKQIPNSNSIVMAGISRHVYLQNPDLFHAIIEHFLSTDECVINPNQGEELNDEGNDPVVAKQEEQASVN